MARDRGGVVLRQIQTLFGAGTVAGLTDGQLLERFATRDGAAAELAFAALVERHGPMVLRVCRRVLADPHDAQDAFQATFLVLVRRAGAVRNRESVASWLYGVAARVAACSRATASRRRAHEQAAARSGEAVQPGLEQDRADLGVVIREELGRLPDRYRDPVILCDLEGQTYEAAARLLGWPVGTIKSRLSRGRRRLRDRLTRRGLAPAVGAMAAMRAAGTSAIEVPAALADSVVRAAARLAAGHPLAGIASANILTLMIGGSQRMLLTKLTLGAAALLASGCLLTAMGTRAPDATRAADPAPEPKPAVVTLPADSPKPDPGPAAVDEDAGILPIPRFRPSIHVFVSMDDQSSRRMKPECDRLDRKGYPVFLRDIANEKVWANQFHVTSVPTIVISDDRGRVLARDEGYPRAERIAAKYRQILAEQIPDEPPAAEPPAAELRLDPAPRTAVVPDRSLPPASDGVAEPALAPPKAIPRPAETVVRIMVRMPNSVSFGSGTIIRSTPEESTILTCAHTFPQTYGPPRQGPPGEIAVDLFDGKSNGHSVDQAETVAGKLVDYDVSQDLGLVTIRPGRQLLASPVVRPGWEPEVGAELTTIGCSEGGDPTALTTRVIAPHHGQWGAEHRGYAGVLCTKAPAPGRSGGGLFTNAGYLAGVSNYAEIEKDRGIYASPESIHQTLARNGLLDEVAAGTGPGRTPAAAPDAPSAAPIGGDADLDALIRVAESGLDRPDRRRARAAIREADEQIRRQGESLRAKLRALELIYPARLERLRKLAESAEARDRTPEATAPPPRPASEPRTPPIPSSPDRDGRMEALERKLDRVIQALEDRKLPAG